MRGFTVLWFGQLVSALGSSMTHFAFVIWVWKATGEATPLALIVLFNAIPAVVLSLFAGVVVDRVSRKRVMILADLGMTIPTLIRLLLLLSGDLQLWHLYLAAAVSGLFAPFQSLAFQAAVTTVVPKSQLTRANGMMSLNEYVSLIGAPVFAGLLLTAAGIEAVLLLDIATFFIAVICATLVHIPSPTPANSAGQLRRSVFSDAVFGFHYIFTRPSLRALLLLIVCFVMFETLGYPLIAPMILARTGSNEVILGTVQAVMGVSGLLGGVLVTVWGGGRNKIRNILLSMLFTGLLGNALMGLGGGLPVWLIAAVFIECFLPLMMSSVQALWQSKVPSEAQGRVFAARGLIYRITEPIPLVFAGLLADHIFEPAMQPQGVLAPVFGDIVGTGAGAGMALLLIICGVLSAFVGVVGFASRNLRDAETLLSDASSR